MRSGDGKGVTSDMCIAISIGEVSAEPGREPICELLPKLLASTFLMLGVRVIGIDLEGGCANSPKLRAVLVALAPVTMHPGIMSVDIRRPALSGLRPPPGLSIDACRREDVSSEESAVGSCRGVDMFGGGEGAIVVDWNLAAPGV